MPLGVDLCSEAHLKNPYFTHAREIEKVHSAHALTTMSLLHSLLGAAKRDGRVGAAATKAVAIAGC